MTTRKPNWPKLLYRFIESKRRMPFAWASNDCCLFTCDWLLELTGIDPAAKLGLRGTYDSALSAARVLTDHGGVEGIAAAFCHDQGWREIGPKYAQQGDPVTIRTANGITLAVCNGVFAVAPGPNGIAFFKMIETASRAWRVE